MIKPATVPVGIDRGWPLSYTIAVQGVDLTGAVLASQVRQSGDYSGPPVLDLAQTTSATATGVRLLRVDDSGPVPVSLIRLQVTTADSAALPPALEAGSVLPLSWDLFVALPGTTQSRFLSGDWPVRPSVTKPTGSVQLVDDPVTAVADAAVSMTDAALTVSVFGADLIAPLLAKAQAIADTVQPLFGVGPPDPGIGSIGSVYYDKGVAGGRLYGPKDAGGWGAGQGLAGQDTQPALDLLASGLGAGSVGTADGLLSGLLAGLKAQRVASDRALTRDRAAAAKRFSLGDLFTQGVQGLCVDIWRDISGLYADAAMTTPAAVGGPVQVIKDRSGNRHDLSTFAANNCPTLQRDAAGYYYLAYSSAAPGTYSYIAASFVWTQGLGRISCIEPTAWTEGAYLFGSDNGDGNGYAFQQHGASPQLAINNGSYSPPIPAPINAPSTITEELFGTQATVAIDNAPRAVLTGLGLNHAEGLYVGCRKDFTGYADFRLYGLVIVDRQLDAVQRGLARFAVSPFTMPLPICFIGDSTVADNSGGNGVQPSLWSFFPDLAVTGLAMPGENIAQQQARWTALSDAQCEGFKAVYVQIGLNNMDTQSVGPTVAALQALVASIRARVVEDCRVYVGTMTPAQGRWPAFYSDADCVLVRAKYEALNDAIMGVSGTPVTGVDGRVTAHTRDMGVTLAVDDSLGARQQPDSLNPLWDIGDHIHPSSYGRRINALAIREALVADGLLRA